MSRQNKTATLERFAYSPLGTFGRIYVGHDLFYTVERPWDDNRRFTSYIPEGLYKVERHNSPKFGDTFIIYDDKNVGKFPGPSPLMRYAILFHAANTMDDLEGCIGLGDTLGFVKGKWAVLNSVATTRTFLTSMRDKGIDGLRITRSDDGNLFSSSFDGTPRR